MPLICNPDLAHSAHQLDIVARELSTLVHRLMDAAAVARGLGDQTDWHSPSAREFHSRAGRWSDEVGAVWVQAQWARDEALRARDDLAWRATLGGELCG
ncbi:hypothetical protein [Microbacterium hominis]|uniref:Uncharacterized protein n=1 Tax=Microbacterium hominis TaxID=162426 RepID=A0A7D4UJC4_9MICO|nr:hypothetical protein [Microbacterium hominis]QKJ20928.1 hypothetical protein HQM25_17225 [Microbacterium hominis]